MGTVLKSLSVLFSLHDLQHLKLFVSEAKELDFHMIRLTKLILIHFSNCKDPVDRKLWQDLQETGVLQKELIDKVFEDLEGGRYKPLQQSVLEMMEKFSFLAKFQHEEEPNQQQNISCKGKIIKYFVPAQLRVSDPTLQKLMPKEGDPCALIYKFCDGFIPHGLFPQLVSRLITLCPMLDCTIPPNLYCDAAHFFLGKNGQYDLVLLCSKCCIKLVFKGYNCHMSSESLENEKSRACQVRTFIEDELKSLSGQWHWLRNARYEVCVTCYACETSDAECNRHQSASCLDQDCLHFLPIPSEVDSKTPFTCPEQVGDHSRFIVSNLHLWYSSSEVR